MKIGNLDISYFKVGGADCSIYLGDTKLYPEDVPPTPPSFDGKYKFTLSDDSVVSGECYSSSELTKSEVSAYTTTLKEAVVGDCVTSIGERAFYNCISLTSCTIGDGVTSIGSSAFQNCSGLTSMDIPDSATSIGEQAFYNCRSLTSCTIGDGVTSIGYYTFYGCSGLTSIDILDSVTSIGICAFKDCSGLTSCTIGDGVTSIGNDAFQNCSSLTICTIGSGVTIIDGYAFQNCSGLTSVTINATTPAELGRNVFDNTNNCQILVPSQSVETYKAASGWKDYASRIQAIPNS